MLDSDHPLGTVRSSETVGAPRPSFRELARLADLVGTTLAQTPVPELSPWERLLRGECAVVDLFDAASRRFLVLRRIPATERASRALTGREREVVARVVAGEANKCIAIDLGLANSTVSTHVSRASAKLGLGSRIDLVRAAACAAALPGQNLRTSPLSVGALRYEVAAFDLAPAHDTVRLTPSEAHVQDAILRGESNAEIACSRRSSVRTVANQVASVFRKWGVSSRCELAAMVAGP